MKSKLLNGTIAGWVLAALATSLFAQAAGRDQGSWCATSKTAQAITGDLILAPEKLGISFSMFPLAQIRALKPAEISAIFGPENEGNNGGVIYRLSVPGDKRFLHKNTLCGSEETQWMVTFVQGKTLQVAFFSGAKMPEMTAEAMANSTDLCGTYLYSR